MKDLLVLKAAFPQSRLVAGNTEVGIERRFKGAKCDVVLCTSAVPELVACSEGPDALVLGACAPLSEIEHLCKGESSTRKESHGHVCILVGDQQIWLSVLLCRTTLLVCLHSRWSASWEQGRSCSRNSQHVALVCLHPDQKRRLPRW